MTYDLTVLIAGGGVGGLALAQGLKKQGIHVRLFERQPEGSAAGYRLHMNGDGGTALEALLPPHLFELYLDTSRTDPEHERLVFLDNRLRFLGGRPHLGALVRHRRKDTAVNRSTLRQILLSGLDDVIERGEVVGFEEDASGVTVILADGRRERGDVLVGFDGVHSRVRAQRLPEAAVVDLGLNGIYGRTPLPPDLQRSIVPELLDGFVIVMGPRLLENGVLAMGAFTPRVPVAEAAEARGLFPDLAPVGPYMMLGAGVPESVWSEVGAEPADASPEQLKAALQVLVRGWHPQIVEMVDRATPGDLFLTQLRYVDAPESWTASRVTLAGDAIHGMPPTLGVGANLALRDAQVLAGALVSVRDGRAASVTDAIGDYEREMRSYAFPLLRRAITQEGSASGFTPRGMLRLMRMVGVRRLVRAARSRKNTVGRLVGTEQKRNHS
ncbi:2-polyprenyl-6-methoxyphenol hydroxylase-like FAD-dependent oxidoreductase [Microbacterium endophyticum]|uniref:2-polyprenyl-6-methoxyphenol hydroxylase-like FAD-dependent oxidoreductase n=1 Tax=Microbacterium endophyticum TaxID=1526412 RepID=A0A7W4V1G0_9MICO|nr:NAD(P)/FAD-dependent oxidoreductase [Microbacterium endophyticum]MBB2975081.1 2-polyprenyl-6-methoxyphenol hydroxylase-like FAD-dependent oxidoreductase [Microbacterium endophyticum]NIK37379.1 2-polyprenyl-6-methoxyphenol hydroxylase-like FAD-dependent oxidoreductase [Microbacterium endophyticum]